MSSFFRVVIPARYASSRLPGKPLLDIAGCSMLERVWRQASQTSAREIIVATDDRRIFTAAGEFGAQVEMTAATHDSGTDRLAEVAQRHAWDDAEVVVNVQGDEPLLPSAVIEQVAALLRERPDAGVATLCEPLVSREDVFDPNLVKVVCDGAGYALYFSRAPVPWARDGFAEFSDPGGKPLPGQSAFSSAWLRHIGIYAYRVDFLRSFHKLPPSNLERIERLEQLRALSSGTRIIVAKACQPVPGGVDTEQDLAEVRRIFADQLTSVTEPGRL